MATEMAGDSRELFGGEVPDEVRLRIEAAKASPTNEVSARLWQLQADAPQCLPVYYLLYKLHAGRRELLEAERAALLGLAESGRQAGLPAAPELPTETQRSAADFASNTPARFWLFTLKALAFIRLRRGEPTQAEQLIGWIGVCDPQHSVGSDVTAALLSAVSWARDAPRSVTVGAMGPRVG